MQTHYSFSNFFILNTTHPPNFRVQKKNQNVWIVTFFLLKEESIIHLQRTISVMCIPKKAPKNMSSHSRIDTTEKSIARTFLFKSYRKRDEHSIVYSLEFDMVFIMKCINLGFKCSPKYIPTCLWTAHDFLHIYFLFKVRYIFINIYTYTHT